MSLSGGPNRKKTRATTKRPRFLLLQQKRPPPSSVPFRELLQVGVFACLYKGATRHHTPRTALTHLTDTPGLGA